MALFLFPSLVFLSFLLSCYYKGGPLFGLDETGASERRLGASFAPARRFRNGAPPVQMQRLQNQSDYRSKVTLWWF